LFAAKVHDGTNISGVDNSIGKQWEHLDQVKTHEGSGSIDAEPSKQTAGYAGQTADLNGQATDGDSEPLWPSVYEMQVSGYKQEGGRGDGR
jgi:hypothetical protein